MPNGTTLNFEKESQAFAKALQAEHLALGDLIEDISVTMAAVSTNGSELGLSNEIVDKAKKAHEAVRFQRARTEAARGRRG